LRPRSLRGVSTGLLRCHPRGRAAESAAGLHAGGSAL